MAPFASKNAAEKNRYTGSTYETVPNNPNNILEKKLPITPHQPKLLHRRNTEIARYTKSFISFAFESCCFFFADVFPAEDFLLPAVLVPVDLVLFDAGFLVAAILHNSLTI
jgi:hypothetical protein